jgi:carboxyl-terminal processing protease
VLFYPHVNEDEIIIEPLKKQRVISKPVIGLFVFVIVLTTFVVGFHIGKQSAVRGSVPAGEGLVLEKGETSEYLADDVSFRMFWDVWNFIKDSYYKQPVSEKDLFYGALRGLVSGVDDPYSVFFDPEDTELFNEEFDGTFSGVGMEIGIRDSQLQVIAPLPDTPAERAGIRTGDKIFAIDGFDTAGMSVEDAVMKIRGEVGTAVVLMISHDDVREVTELSIIREVIKVDSVKWSISNGIATITITSFNDDTAKLFNSAAQETLTADVDGIVLDLRNNPGGRLDTAVGVASEWVNGRTVVIQRLMGVDKATNGSGTPRFAGIPTVVLVNGGSASASEIVAGALKDYDFATIVGETTFGKGSVQDYQMLPDGSSVKLTVAEWLTPLGNSINETGIEPDVAVELTIEDIDAGVDPQMDAALKILNGSYGI